LMLLFATHPTQRTDQMLRPLLICSDPSGARVYLVAPPERPLPAGAVAVTLTKYLHQRFDPRGRHGAKAPARRKRGAA
jgi:hypothetical protein